MISKSQKDFNDELDAYINNRSGSTSSRNFLNKSFSFLKFSGDGRVPNVPVTESTVYESEHKPSIMSILFSRFFSRDIKNDLEDIDDLPPQVVKEVEEMEEEIEHIDEEVEDLEDKRESLLTRLFSIFRREKSDEMDIDHENQEVELDENELLRRETREALRTIHKWIGRLSPEQINAFKRSPDFQKYKDILDRYGLIK